MKPTIKDLMLIQAGNLEKAAKRIEKSDDSYSAFLECSRLYREAEKIREKAIK